MSDSEIIPSLPFDIALDCLLRVPTQCRPALHQVCRSWNSVVSSSSYHQSRARLGYTDLYVCFIQADPHPSSSLHPCKSPPLYSLSIYDANRLLWDRLPPLPDFPHSLPLFCRCVSFGTKLVLIGGWDPSSWAVLRCVYVYDLALGQWERRSDMPSSRSFFACVAADGKVVVAGGHDGNKNALRSAEVYSIESDEWAAMPEMNEERDECQAVVMGKKIVVISGFSTDSQGQYMRSAEIYDEEGKKWEVVGSMWPAGAQPSSATSLKGQVYAVFDGKLMRYKAKEEQWEALADIPKGVGVPSCVTPLGNAIILLGGEQQAAYKCSVGAAPYAWQEVHRSADYAGIVHGACTMEV